jgi:hypothetical protein
MKRTPRLRRIVSARDRRLASEVPAVPSFQPNPETTQQDISAQAGLEQDAGDEAVRRMVEAAYT